MKSYKNRQENKGKKTKIEFCGRYHQVARMPTLLQDGIELSAVEILSDGKVSPCNMTVGVPVKFSDGSYGLITCGHDIKEGMSIYQPKYDENNDLRCFQ